MRNLYSIITNQAAIIALRRVVNRDRIATAWFGGIALFVGLFEVAVLAVAYPQCPSGERIEMRRPFTANGGASYYANMPDIARISDDPGHLERSPIVICEENRMIGPAHAIHGEILRWGRGRFSHWGDDLVFSASDNSDPNANGRSYLVIRPDGR